MNLYQTVEEYLAPREKMKEWRDGDGALFLDKVEMTESQTGFLCGLIRKFRPKKLVEVGVSAGGTSVAILNCLQMLGLQTRMYSVDLAETCYLDRRKEAGYLIRESKEYGIDLSGHTLFTGRVIAAYLDQIGPDIDFLILDTAHVMPGEVLDFLSVFPYLKKDAVVVLHDVSLPLWHTDCTIHYASGALYQSVVAEKYLNHAVDYPNIGGFQINEDTRKYIVDVFAALAMPWSFIPEKKDLEDYDVNLDRHYPEECLLIWRQLMRQQKNRMEELEDRRPYMDMRMLANVRSADNVLIYGTKELGRTCLACLLEQNIPVKGFIVSDGWKEEDDIDGIPVYEYSEIPCPIESTLILLANYAKATRDRLKTSPYWWADVSLV